LSANDQIRLRLASLRIALELRAEQTSAWQVYENKVMEMLSELESATGPPADGNALTQIDRQLVAERKRAATLEELFSAAKALYIVLSDDQKRVADSLLLGTMPMESLAVGPSPRERR
jgi:hypothetical protein